MDNLVLKIEFDIEVLHEMSYTQLTTHSNTLRKTISDLEEMKKTAVLMNLDVKAVEIQGYIHNASYNRNLMLTVMLIKEDDVCQHGSIKTLWLN